MSAVELMLWTWFAWAGAAVWYIGYLRCELSLMEGFARQLHQERKEYEGLANDHDELLKALYAIVDEPNLISCRHIACDAIGLPVTIYPALRRSA